MNARQVKILKAAQAKWNAKREASGKGVSEIGNGVVVRDGGIIIGRVSYNGRIWDVNGNEVQALSDEDRENFEAEQQDKAARRGADDLGLGPSPKPKFIRE